MAIGIADFNRSGAIGEVYGDAVFNRRAFIMHGCKTNVAKKYITDYW
jgi:hypothetical protein